MAAFASSPAASSRAWVWPLIPCGSSDIAVALAFGMRLVEGPLPEPFAVAA